MLRFVCVVVFAGSLSASSILLSPIVVKAKRNLQPKWQFIEALANDRQTTPGFEEQSFKNVPGLTITTNGNPGQLTTVSIQGAASRYTKILWAGLSINETETDAALVPFSAGKVEVIKGIHCAEYGNGAIGGIVNVIPFAMPHNQNGGAAFNIGNTVQHGHFWWTKETNGFSMQQHLESDSFHGKNSISKPYQNKYPTSKSPRTEKQYFLNQFAFASHHGKAKLQLGLLKSNSTGSNINFVKPCDSRSKRSLQIYALDMEGTQENIQPHFKFLNTKIISRDCSPYQNAEYAHGFTNTKARLGIKIKKNHLIFEPIAEHHHSALNAPTNKPKKNSQYAFIQGIHLNHGSVLWKNWARIQKASSLRSVYALSSSLLSSYNDTEFSVHIGSGFRLPDLYILNDINHGNSKLKNETAHGGNIGVAQRTPIGTFNILIFKTEYKSQITYNNGRYINLNKASQNGVEFGWKHKISAWGTQISSTYVESVALKPRRSLSNIPRFSANARVFYQKNQIVTSLGCRYTGHQTQPDFENTNLSINRGGYLVVFADFSYKFMENTTWNTAIENALNRNVESLPGYRNPGFQIQTGVSITW